MQAGVSGPRRFVRGWSGAWRTSLDVGSVGITRPTRNDGPLLASPPPLTLDHPTSERPKDGHLVWRHRPALPLPPGRCRPCTDNRRPIQVGLGLRLADGRGRQLDAAAAAALAALAGWGPSSPGRRGPAPRRRSRWPSWRRGWSRTARRGRAPRRAGVAAAHAAGPWRPATATGRAARRAAPAGSLRVGGSWRAPRPRCADRQQREGDQAVPDADDDPGRAAQRHQQIAGERQQGDATAPHGAATPKLRRRPHAAPRRRPRPRLRPGWSWGTPARLLAAGLPTSPQPLHVPWRSWTD